MTASPTSLYRRLLQGVAGLLGLGAFLCGLLALGDLAFQQIRTWPRYTVPFSAIECAPPPGQKRGDFLDEVQYLAALPDQLHLLDEGLAPRLALAFGRHPWVERVEQVDVLPPRRIRVRLAYRVPVLAVRGDAEPPNSAALEPGRAVDWRGILLPPKAPREGLPVLVNRVKPPAGPAGTAWGDANVAAAARVAQFLRPYQDKFRLEEVEVTREGVVLRAPWVRILWGRPPGAERAGEAAAATKVERLLAFCKDHGGLAGPIPAEGEVSQEHDVRPADQAVHRLVRQAPPKD